MTVDYNVILSDAFGEELDVLNDYVSLEYTRKVNNVGALSIILPDNRDFATYRKDGRIEIYQVFEGVQTLEAETVWFIRKKTRYLDDSGQYFVRLDCQDTIGLLNRRIVAFDSGTCESEKPLAGCATLSTLADDIIKDIVNENMGTSAGERSWYPYFIVQPKLSQSEPIYKSFAWRNLLQTIQEICDTVNQDCQYYFYPNPYFKSAYLCFDIVPTVTLTTAGENVRTFEFRTYINQRGDDRSISGKDNPIILSPELGNVSNLYYEKDFTEEWSFVYAGGPGEGEDRCWSYAGDSQRINQSPFGDIEYFTDASFVQPLDPLLGCSDPQLVSELADEARWTLEAGRPKVTFTCDVKDTPAISYGIDFVFGDRLTVQFGTLSYDVRVDSVTVTLANGQRTVSISLRED